jgi:hypothetical protein
MAGDRVEKFLQAVFNTQKASGLAEDFAPGCGTIPLHDQDPYGEVKGTLYFLLSGLRFMIYVRRQMTGERFLVSCRFAFSRTSCSLFQQIPWQSIVPNHWPRSFRSR